MRKLAVDFGRERVLCGQMPEKESKPVWTFKPTDLDTVRVAMFGVPGETFKVCIIDILRPLTFKNNNGEQVTENTWFPINLVTGEALQEGMGMVLTMIEPASEAELQVARAAAANF